VFSPQMLKPITVGSVNSSYPLCEPAFIGLGTPKAGTSWWYEQLLQHPQIRDNRFNVKESCYFCHNWPEEQHGQMIENYFQAFQGDANLLCGEWSTLYFSHPSALKRVVQACPSSLLMLTFREPSRCFESWVNQILNRRAKSLLVPDNPDAFYMYLNYDVIPNIHATILSFPAKLAYLQSVANDRLLVLQYEKNRQDPYKELHKTYEFLGVDKNFKNRNVSDLVNKTENHQFNLTQVPKHMVEELHQTTQTLLAMLPEFSAQLWD
jgi:hypothetical protein